MFGNLGELAGLMKKFKDLKANLEKMKDLEVVGDSDDDRVKVVIKGDLTVKELILDPQSVKVENIEELQQQIIVAFNKALQEIKTITQKEISDSTGLPNIPGLF